MRKDRDLAMKTGLDRTSQSGAACAQISCASNRSMKPGVMVAANHRESNRQRRAGKQPGGSGGGALLNERVEPVQIDGLDQVMIEADVAAPPQILFHSETGERDPKDRVIVLELLHQIDADSVRETDVAHQDIEALVGGELQGRFNAPRRLHLITAAAEQVLEGTVRVRVVFHVSDP